MDIEKLNVFVAVIFSLVCGICDFRSGKISAWIFIIFASIAVCLGHMRRENLCMLFISMMPGICLIILSWCRIGIGLGDGIFYMILAFHLNPDRILFVLMGSLIFSAFWALWLIAVEGRHLNLRKTELPFLFISMPVLLGTSLL